MKDARDYLVAAPKRLPSSFKAYGGAIRKSLKTFHFLIRHTLSVHGEPAAPREEIAENSPAGPIRPKLLVRIERLWELARTRTEQLEQKSSAMLSGLGIAAPIVIAFSAYIVQESAIATWVKWTSFSLSVIAISSMALGFFAVLRALSVRVREELGIDSVVLQRTFRDASDDFQGRGLLYVYTRQQAINDHVANFVRAAQTFLAIAIALVLLAGIAIIPGIAAESGRRKPDADTALLKVANTLEKLREKADHSTQLRLNLVQLQQEQKRLQQELDATRLELQSISARMQASDAAVLLPSPDSPAQSPPD